MLKYYICVILLVALLESSFQTHVTTEDPDDNLNGMNPKGPAPTSGLSTILPGCEKGHHCTTERTKFKF
ncbi:unnamed protein product [Leptidea sinapis]|uniref:Uncharacterized protein n=1 Tax=Leptidea sinapis TaxID=189913 RepID=A0A5E4R4L1_9NEOP|nr:unnamed protein product [Leptidea sinapis]